MIDLPTDDTAAELDRLRLALQSAQIGTWALDVQRQQVWWDARCQQLYGFRQEDIVAYEQVLSYIHEEDRQRVDEALQWTLNPHSDGLYDVHFRTLGGDDNQIRWLQCRGRADVDAQGVAVRLTGTAQDITQQVVQQQAVLASEARFRSLIEEAPVATSLFVGRQLRVEVANPLMLAIWGKGPHQIGKPFAEVLPEMDNQPFLTLLDNVYTSGQTYSAKGARTDLVIDGIRGTYYFDFTYKPLVDATHKVYAILQMTVDVTQQVLARQQLEDSEYFARTLFAHSPVAKAVFVGQEMVIRTANQNMLRMWGKESSIIGRPFMEAMPELIVTPQLERLQRVLHTGERFYEAEEKFDLIRYGVPYTGYYEYTYEALRSASGAIYGVICVASEITQQVLARQKLEISEAKLRSLIASAPAAIGLFVGPDLILENLNQTFLEAVGKGPYIEGLPLREAMPELMEESQPFLTILDEIYTTGVPYSSPAALVKITKDGVLTDNYYNLSYTPLYNEAGQIYAILDIAVDVTRQIHDQQALKESQARLASVIDLTDLGVYTIDLTTNQMIKSPRLASWYGLPEQTDVTTSLSVIQEADRARVSQTLSDALRGGSSGYYNVEYGVIHARTGQQRVLRTTGQVISNSQGQPVRIDGSVLDITAQRALQLVLEQQVHQRTQELVTTSKELAATNEELAASNEEYTALNEELLITNENYARANQALEVANQDLLRSNQNLEQFAYIASHDLQEPLRKIQQFGDLLQGQYSDVLGEGTTYLQRMQAAASRMSVLIRDLLAFSRIATTQAVAHPVALPEVINQVLESLSVAIEESAAQIEVDDLPTVQGDGLQLSQLFQNLLSNALKFRRTSPEGTSIAPQIRVRSRLLAKGDLPLSVKPARYADRYHLIEVADNGIGFEAKYLDRIFQVFQRLHGKNEFAGTGVGLAIVQKVVTNHGGAITASGKLGEGATFCVYLPA